MDNNYLDKLNEAQRQAVIYSDGPSLIVAGAGSGKTRVLTYKIAYLLENGVSPYGILALTFTNKAANEMKERIAQIVGQKVANRLWMGTFHSIFYRILRVEADKIGFTSDFTIYDSSDSKSLVKSIIKSLQLDDKVYKVGNVLARISLLKNNLVFPHEYASDSETTKRDYFAKIPAFKDIYSIYCERCRQANAMDFDDLLLYTKKLFYTQPDVLRKYQERFLFVLIDEYQDTNYVQHLIVNKLAECHKRIAVVGDDAQSIYSFRGANIDNILTFQRNYPDCKLFKLEQNYRSTQTIVNAANSLISKNNNQIRKSVFSKNNVGEKLCVIEAYSDFDEAFLVTNQIENLKRKGYGFSDFAVLYRTNSQSRVLEEALRKRNFPYKIYGGVSFYQRKEIKDILTYFRLAINHSDDESLKRIINYPARGIGKTTLDKVFEMSALHGCSAFEVVKNPISYNLNINNGTASKLLAFAALIEQFSELIAQKDAFEVAEIILKQSGIWADIMSDKTVEGQSRKENIEELMNAISEFRDKQMNEGNSNASLSDFLSEVSLLTDMDKENTDDAEKITLMTVHASKGLEFKNVFVVGLEEQLFPSQMCQSSAELEEERRLLYVAITRAEENCFLSYAKSRFRNGETQFSMPSRFFNDIDAQFLRKLNEKTTFLFQKPEKKKVFFSSTPQETKDLSRLKSINSLNQTNNTDYTSNFNVGDKVLHSVFGEGIILNIDGNGANEKACVSFDSVGEKQLLLKYARLTIIK